MPDSDGMAPSVMEQVEPAAQQQPPGINSDFEALKAKFELVQADSLKKGQTNQKLNERLIALEKEKKELETNQATARKTELADQGQWESLWKESEARNKLLEDQLADLQRQLQDKDSQFNAERLRNSALGQIAAANALNPDHLLTLLESTAQLREIEGKPVVMSGGAAVPLSDYLTNLKQPSSGWAQYFSASGAKGMNAAPSVSAAPGMVNPYKGSSKNLTQALLLERENPDLAAVLKAEALR